MAQPEQAQATLALQGLEGFDGPDAATRVYRGPPNPEALLAHLGHEAFRPGQREAVQAALDGRDALIVMPTGGGKSLCYQLPGLASPELSVVVSPLIALMADQCLRMTAAGHPVVMIASGLGAEANREALARVRDGRARIVYCSPERFGSSSFLDAVASRDVDLLAVDEAHCVSEWGHDFRPDYLRLPKAIERLGRPTVMACTATATPEVAVEIERRLGLREPLVVRSGFDRPNISFDTVALEGKGSKARKLAPARARPAARPRTGRRSSTAGRAATARRSRSRCERRGCWPPPITPAWPLTSAPPRSIASCPETRRSSSPPTPSAWASTRPTCARSGIGRSRPASRPTTRRPGERGATAGRRARCCSPGAPTWGAWCASTSSAASTRRRSPPTSSSWSASPTPTAPW